VPPRQQQEGKRMAKAKTKTKAKTKKPTAVKVSRRTLDEWEVKNAVDTLQRAEQISQDPQMMKAVRGEVRKQKKALDTVARKVKE